MTHDSEAFYTCGGITLAQTDISPTEYAVVSSEAPDFLSVYKKADGEPYEPYMPEDMVLSAKRDELTPELQDIHAELLNALQE